MELFKTPNPTHVQTVLDPHCNFKRNSEAPEWMQPTPHIRSRQPPSPPQWLSNQTQLMQAKYPHDKFEVFLPLRRVHNDGETEWRMKCLDCPGKLYKSGPEETLRNYEVHLKNRMHRRRVNERVYLEGFKLPTPNL